MLSPSVYKSRRSQAFHYLTGVRQGALLFHSFVSVVLTCLFHFGFFLISLNGDKHQEFRKCDYGEIFSCNSLTGNTVMNRVLLYVEMRAAIFRGLGKFTLTS